MQRACIGARCLPDHLGWALIVDSILARTYPISYIRAFLPFCQDAPRMGALIHVYCTGLVTIGLDMRVYNGSLLSCLTISKLRSFESNVERPGTLTDTPR